MQVFQLYMIRFSKRLGIISLIIALPLIVVFSYVSMVETRQDEDYTKLLLSMVAILMIVAWALTRLFASDMKYKTNQRLLLGVNSKLKLFGSMIALYVVITILQLIIMLAALHVGTDSSFKLSWDQIAILMTSYGMLTVLITGVSFLILHSKHIVNPLKKYAIEFTGVLSLILGLVIHYESVPLWLKPFILAIPTQWIVEITNIVVTDLSMESNQIIIYLSALLLNCAIVMILLAKLNTKTS